MAKKINRILFEFDSFEQDDLKRLIKELPLKQVRWLAACHSDNRTRKMLLRLSNIQIGEESVINRNFIVSDDYKPLLKIGCRVAISPNVTIICCSAPNNSSLIHNSYVSSTLIQEKEVVIEDDVWIGANVVILPGVVIRKSSVIGAGSVVTTSVEPFSVNAGVPAKKIRNI